MSFSRGTKGEVLWSRCSADVIEKLDMPCLTESSAPAPSAENDHFAKYKNVPGSNTFTLILIIIIIHVIMMDFIGLIWSPVEQCQFLLQDKRAKLNHDPSNMPEMCDRYLGSTSRPFYFSSFKFLGIQPTSIQIMLIFKKSPKTSLSSWWGWHNRLLCSRTCTRRNRLPEWQLNK